MHGCFTARQDGAEVPADFDLWSVGVYGGACAFQVPVTPVPERSGPEGALRRGESFCFDALVPDWRMDVYALQECDVQGPFPPGERDWYYPIAHVDVVRRGPDLRAWGRPYPPDEGVYGVRDQDYHVGLLSVRFRPGIRPEQAERIAEAEGCIALAGSPFERMSWLSVRFPPDRTIEEAVRRFEGWPEVESTTPSYIGHYYK